MEYVEGIPGIKPIKGQQAIESIQTTEYTGYREYKEWELSIVGIAENIKSDSGNCGFLSGYGNSEDI